MVKILTLGSDGSFAEVVPVLASSGPADASKTVQTDAGGKLDISLLPTGVGADTQSLPCYEGVSAGDFVNIFSNSGARSIRKASAVDTTKPANGFVLTAFSSGATALVYMRGLNSQVSKGALSITDVGSTVFLSASTAGGVTTARPTTAGNIVQPLGPIVDVSGGTTMTINFSQQPRTTLA